MEGNFQACLNEVLKLEGGYIDRPQEEGGPINLGITLPIWQTWLGRNRVAMAADIAALTLGDVTPIYQQVFWRGCNARYLPLGVDLCTFDWCVNNGVREGNMGLQKALGVSVDGLVGPQTIHAAEAMEPLKLLLQMHDLRAELEPVRAEGIYVAALDMLVQKAA